MEIIKSLKFSNYKNIGDNFVGFDCISNFNILIGKNNIGKSTLIKVLQILMDPKNGEYKNLENTKCYFKFRPLDTSVLTEKYTGTDTRMIINNLKEIELYECELIFKRERTKKGLCYKVLSSIDDQIENSNLPRDVLERYLGILADCVWDFDISSSKIIKLVAERDLVAEDESYERTVSVNGEGATNLLRQYLHVESLDNDIVETRLLDALNRIVQPEEHFSAILCQEIGNVNGKKQWEILLVNQNGKIRVSDSGSGLKTILLVLIKIFLESDTNVTKGNINKVIYIFEELENNLHPSIQRNLFKFLHEWAVENDTCVFITTHSSVPLNMFGGRDSVTITHLSKVNGELQTNSNLSFLQNENVLMDLGVRASDILQSNAVVWVEGPSDRVYLNKWIELYSDGAIRENEHYQILFYGGRLLSHLSGLVEFSNDLIQLFRANRHSIIMIDSDKKNQNSKINKTKQRIKKEFEEMNSLCWVTKGKEIENYLTKATIFKTFGVNSQIDQYESIEEFLNKTNHNKKDGTKYIRNKVEGAVSLCKNMTREDLKILDLEKKIELIVEKIKEWNGI